MLESGARETVAVIGAGRMGSAIAQRLADSGLEVKIFNRSSGPVTALLRPGIVAAETPAAAAEGCEVVVSCLLDDAALEAIVRGEHGLAAGMGTDAVHVSTTTASPGYVRALETHHAKNGQLFVGAPVVGRPDAARSGQLVSLLGGSDDAQAAATHVVDRYSHRIVSTGHDPGIAAALKLSVNFYVVATIEVFAEVLAFAEHSGVSVETAADVLDGVVAGGGLRHYLQRIRDSHYSEPGFAMTGGLKDASLIVDAANAVGATVPVADVAKRNLALAVEQGLGDLDWSAIATLLRPEIQAQP